MQLLLGFYQTWGGSWSVSWADPGGSHHFWGLSAAGPPTHTSGQEALVVLPLPEAT